MNILFTIVALLSGLFLLAQLANLVEMQKSDPLGRSLSHSFGILITIGLWVLIVVLLALAWRKGPFPGFAGWAVLFLLPASLAAQLAMNNLFKSTFHVRWLIVPDAILSLVPISFAVALWFPSLRPVIEYPLANWFIWGSVLLSCMLPWPAVRKQSLWNQAEVAKHQRPEASEMQPRE